MYENYGFGLHPLFLIHNVGIEREGSKIEKSGICLISKKSFLWEERSEHRCFFNNDLFQVIQKAFKRIQ
jgi:hypothetical protein